MKTLIVIDYQNDFVTGVLGTPEAAAILTNVKAKIEEYLRRGDEVIFTRDTHTANYLNTTEGKQLPVPHCIIGTDGWNVVESVDNADCEHINKDTFGYANWELRYDINDNFCGERNFDEIEIIGVCTDICVVSNALLLKAFYPDVPITVDVSCCAGTTPEAHRAALTVMKSCQINVIGE